MKLSFLVLGLSTLLLVLAVVASAQTSVSELFERTSPSVVLVIANDASGKPIARGTGFCVAPGKVVTNKHVIEKATSILIKTNSDETYEAFKKSIDQSGDLALLESIELGNNVKPLKVAKASPNIGDRVVVIGNPLGLEGSLSDGIVSSFRNSASLGKLIQITAPISHGSSGSPVINLNGDVVGVATLSLEAGQNLNFAISSDRVLLLWKDELSISNSTAPKDKPREFFDFLAGRFLKTEKNDFPNEWLLVESSDTEDFLLNPAKGRKVGNVVHIWEQIRDKADGVVLGVYKNEINCSEKTYRTVQGTTYFETRSDSDSDSGKVKILPRTETDPDAPFLEPTPDSVAESIIKWGCVIYDQSKMHSYIAPLKKPSKQRKSAGRHR